MGGGNEPDSSARSPGGLARICDKYMWARASCKGATLRLAALFCSVKQYPAGGHDTPRRSKSRLSRVNNVQPCLAAVNSSNASFSTRPRSAAALFCRRARIPVARPASIQIFRKSGARLRWTGLRSIDSAMAATARLCIGLPRIELPDADGELGRGRRASARAWPPAAASPHPAAAGPGARRYRPCCRAAGSSAGASPGREKEACRPADRRGTSQLSGLQPPDRTADVRGQGRDRPAPRRDGRSANQRSRRTPRDGRGRRAAYFGVRYDAGLLLGALHQGRRHAPANDDGLGASQQAGFAHREEEAVGDAVESGAGPGGSRSAAGGGLRATAERWRARSLGLQNMGQRSTIRRWPRMQPVIVRGSLRSPIFLTHTSFAYRLIFTLAEEPLGQNLSNCAPDEPAGARVRAIQAARLGRAAP